jgi:oxygen-dependent protoporphyrinogen oxidase
MAEMDRAHGSLVRAMLAKAKERQAAKRRLAELRAQGEDAPELARPGGPAGPGGTLTSFRGGIETLVHGLAGVLGDTLRTGARVETLGRGPDGAWQLDLAGGERLDADAVLLASPAPAAAALVAPLDAALAATLAAIPTAPLAVVALGYDAGVLGGAPRGFGFLAPPGEGLRLLGCLWDSSLFPGRAPAGKVLLRAMIGGARDPEAIRLSDPGLIAAVRGDLRRAMGIAVEPEQVWIFRHPLGISQYTLGHRDRLAAIAQGLARHPGLHVAGQSYFGISMNACIEQAPKIAAQLLP